MLQLGVLGDPTSCNSRAALCLTAAFKNQSSCWPWTFSRNPSGPLLPAFGACAACSVNVHCSTAARSLQHKCNPSATDSSNKSDRWQLWTPSSVLFGAQVCALNADLVTGFAGYTAYLNTQHEYGNDSYQQASKGSHSSARAGSTAGVYGLHSSPDHTALHIIHTASTCYATTRSLFESNAMQCSLLEAEYPRGVHFGQY